MKKEILFIAPFPNDQSIKDGMGSRVKAIDELFSKDKRTYLTMSFTKYTRKSSESKIGRVKVLKRNVFLHYIDIYYILKNSSVIYCHSIYNILPIVFILPFLKAKIILDIHGVVTNELYLNKKYIKSFLYGLVESLSFKKIDIAIGVTNRMCEHFMKKYPNFKGEFITYNIFPESLAKGLTEKLTPFEKTIIIYSGNAQKWQNIDLMMKTIKNNQNANLQFIILSGEDDKFNKIVSEYNICSTNITIKSVAPSELKNYYLIASYGFILRDDSVINKVASPTKLIEYLMYGIIPIVWNEDIGDFVSMNYEFIKIEDMPNISKPQKSFRNVIIARKLYDNNINMNYKDKILQ